MYQKAVYHKGVCIKRMGCIFQGCFRYQEERRNVSRRGILRGCVFLFISLPDIARQKRVFFFSVKVGMIMPTNVTVIVGTTFRGTGRVSGDLKGTGNDSSSMGE